MVLILDINIFSSFLECCSLTVNIFVFIHRKPCQWGKFTLDATSIRDENSQTFSIQKTCQLDPEWSHTDF